MFVIHLLASIIGLVLGIAFTIFVLILIDTIIFYVKAKTELINRQIEEHDFSYPKEPTNEK